MPPEHEKSTTFIVWLQLDHHRLSSEDIGPDFGGGTNNDIWVMVMVDLTQGPDGAPRPQTRFKSYSRSPHV